MENPLCFLHCLGLILYQETNQEQNNSQIQGPLPEGNSPFDFTNLNYFLEWDYLFPGIQKIFRVKSFFYSPHYFQFSRGKL